MTKDEALKLALEALESAKPKYTRQRKDQMSLGGALDYWMLEQYQRLAAIAAIKEALAQPVQEPVAWISHNAGLYHFKPDDSLDPLPLYLAPPAAQQRPWVGLTDDEIKYEWEIWRASLPRYVGFAKGIEAKLKEKNVD